MPIIPVDDDGIVTYEGAPPLRIEAPAEATQLVGHEWVGYAFNFCFGTTPGMIVYRAVDQNDQTRSDWLALPPSNIAGQVLTNGDGDQVLWGDATGSVAAFYNPIVYNVSGTPDNGTNVTLTYVATCPIRISTDPSWFAYSGTPPGTSRSCSVSKVISGALSTVGDVEVDTNGVVSSSPAWATEDLAEGDAIRITLPFDGTWTDVGIGFLAHRIPV